MHHSLKGYISIGTPLDPCGRRVTDVTRPNQTTNLGEVPEVWVIADLKRK